MRIATIQTLMNSSCNLMVRGVPVTSTIVELDDSSLAIIDTGMAGNSDLLEQLDDIGYRPEDFNLVINTHLHPDHAGGNWLFANATILISRRELMHQKTVEGMVHDSTTPGSLSHGVDARTMNVRAPVIDEIAKLIKDYPASGIVGADEQIEYFEDMPLLPQGISLIDVPGHSIDHRAVILEGAHVRALAAGDAYFHREIDNFAPIPSLNYNEKLFRQSAKKISGFSGIIVPGHDRAFDNRTRQYMAVGEFIDL